MSGEHAAKVGEIMERAMEQGLFLMSNHPRPVVDENQTPAIQFEQMQARAVWDHQVTQQALGWLAGEFLSLQEEFKRERKELEQEIRDNQIDVYPGSGW